MDERIWLTLPHMSGEEEVYVRSAFDSNWIAPVGPYIKTFEKELCDYCGSRYAVALSSGTAAIHLGLKMLGVGPGDHVVCQSLTFVGTVNPVIYLGAKPVFIDSERDTWNMDPDLAEQAIVALDLKGKKPKAIIPVHLYGMPAKMKAIRQLASKYGISVLEDAAEALGSVYMGEKCGNLGDLSVVSFNGNKIITTSGGGALLGNDQKTADKVRFLATQAREDAPHYEHAETGYNYRLSNILAGIGIGQLKALEERVARKRFIFKTYFDFFSNWNNRGFRIDFQQEPEDVRSNRWLTCVLIDPALNNGLTSEKLRIALEEENIESRPLWKPMHLQPVFKGEKFFGGEVSDSFFHKGLCLPSGTNMSEADLDRILGVCNRIFKQFSNR